MHCPKCLSANLSKKRESNNKDSEWVLADYYQPDDTLNYQAKLWQHRCSDCKFKFYTTRS